MPNFATDPGQLFIGGRWVETSDRLDVLNPATGERITTIAAGGSDQVDQAVTAAADAFPAWRAITPRERSAILQRVAQLVRERADDLAALESLDVGKPITLARHVDVETVADTFEYYAGLARSIDGAHRAVGIPAHAYTTREPLGVIGAITPFNFPLILSTSKLASALAAGNTIVHKPAEETSLTALAMAELLQEAGVPDGVVNVVTGTGGDAGEALLRHPGIAKVAFTGSTRIGRHAATVAGEALKPVTMELGGNAAQLLFADADLDSAIQAVVKAFVFNSGQFCMAGPRLLVDHRIHDTVLDILAAAIPQVPLGDPSDPATVIGPMAGEKHLRNVEDFIQQAKSEGGRIIAGGNQIDQPGFFHEATVIAGLPNDSRVVQDEIFGPVLTVQSFDTTPEAVTLANSTAYGLAAGLYTRDVARAHKVAAALDAGIVWVNDWSLLDPAMPFGGVKTSGFGGENGPEGLDAYLRTKSVLISLAEVAEDAEPQEKS